jgi:hypothetical protein
MTFVAMKKGAKIGHGVTGLINNLDPQIGITICSR